MVATVTFALTAPNETILLAGIALKLVPKIVTVEPIGPDTGETEVIVGGGAVKIKPARLPVPAGVVTDTLPVAPLPTTAEIAVEPITVKEAAGTLPKLTLVVPVKLEPAIITDVPEGPVVGENVEIVGA